MRHLATFFGQTSENSFGSRGEPEPLRRSSRYKEYILFLLLVATGRFMRRLPSGAVRACKLTGKT
jgi:hypothetical protein